MGKLFRTSHAKVKVWRKCRQAAWYRYIEKLKKRTVARPLQFGRMVHEMIEADANGLDPMKHLAKISKRDDKMFRSQREEYGDLVNDVRIIMSEYFDYWEDHPDKNKRVRYIEVKGKSSEFTFEVEVAKNILAICKVDNFAETPNKLRWLTEHKSGKAMLSEDHRWRNLQSAVYIKVNDMAGLKPLDGTLWDFIRSKPPSAPQFLKTGELSARGLDTLPTKVFEALKEAKKKPGDKKYQLLIKLAERNRSTYFQRVFNPVKKDMVEFLFKSFVNTSQEMAEQLEDPKAISMNIDRHCDWCDFESLCRARLQGLDYDFVKKREFEVRGKAPELEVDFEA